MIYRVVDGKMIRDNDDIAKRKNGGVSMIESNYTDKKVSYTWTMPEVKRPIAPFMEDTGLSSLNSVNSLWKGNSGVMVKSSLLGATPVFMMGVVADPAGAGIFWDTFVKFIFPYFLDIAKVFCAIKIAQGFYEEHRGGGKGNSGFGSLINYGKWYILFALLPTFVNLIDELGKRMLDGLN